MSLFPQKFDDVKVPDWVFNDERHCRVEIGNILVEDGHKEFAITVKSGRTVIEMPANYLTTIFIMTPEDYHRAVEVFGEHIILLERYGSIYFVIADIDTKDALDCITTIEIRT